MPPERKISKFYHRKVNALVSAGVREIRAIRGDKKRHELHESHKFLITHGLRELGDAAPRLTHYRPRNSFDEREAQCNMTVDGDFGP
jgi:hypothetical protein